MSFRIQWTWKPYRSRDEPGSTNCKAGAGLEAPVSSLTVEPTRCRLWAASSTYNARLEFIDKREARCTEDICTLILEAHNQNKLHASRYDTESRGATSFVNVAGACGNVAQMSKIDLLRLLPRFLNVGEDNRGWTVPQIRCNIDSFVVVKRATALSFATPDSDICISEDGVAWIRVDISALSAPSSVVDHVKIGECRKGISSWALCEVFISCIAVVSLGTFFRDPYLVFAFASVLRRRDMGNIGSVSTLGQANNFARWTTRIRMMDAGWYRAGPHSNPPLPQNHAQPSTAVENDLCGVEK
ncbi:hypothetical protein DFH09DRAFT_1103994 [Mycena vulgaris]|nr:hypothetical protein DFH09DRAFT_1103994 [Mycena vulgaris]